LRRKHPFSTSLSEAHMTSRRFQVIVAGTKIGFAVKPLRSVSRKFTKAWIATVRDLCIDFDISGHANLTSIRASDAIPAPSAFISTLPGKYQVLLRTDCKTLEWQEGTPKLLSMTIESAPLGTNCKRVLRLPGFRNCRYDPAYPVNFKYPSDSTWTPGDFRLDIAAANAMLLPCSIPSRKRSGKPTNSAHNWGVLYATTPPWRRHRNRASFGVGSIPMGDVVTMLDVRRRFEIPAAFYQARSRKIALAAQRILLGTDSDFTNSIRTNNATT
jgi:RepB DNA-primase from phage plasmid